MANNEIKIRENIVEISRLVQWWVGNNYVPVEDSKDLAMSIISWTEEFEQENADVDYNVDLGPTGEPRDYYLEIEAFAENKIQEYFC